jgi:hypothetical protein
MRGALRTSDEATFVETGAPLRGAAVTLVGRNEAFEAVVVPSQGVIG